MEGGADLHGENPGGVQAPKSRARGVMDVARFILVTEFCERLAFYGIVGNLVLFLTDRLHHSTSSADAITQLFIGTCFLTPVLGGWCADAHWGRYRTIMAFSTLYLVGLAALATGSFPALSSDAVVLSALLLIAVGTGGIKPNVSAFGAEQLVAPTEADVRSYFNWFYFAINLGSLLAFTAVVYIQQQVSFTAGYLVPTVAMLAAVAAFRAGRPRYRTAAPSGSLLQNVAAAATAAAVASRCRCCCRRDRTLRRMRASVGGPVPDATVAHVRAVGRLLPVFLTLVPYWAIYSQMSSVFVSQGERLDLRLGGAQLPVAGLQLFDTLIILLLVPLVDRAVYPALARRGRAPSALARIGVGHALAAAAVLAAAALEASRLADVRAGRTVRQRVVSRDVVASSASVLWQVPQFVAIGASEVFASITALEFAFERSPPELRGVIMAVNLLTTAAGSYLGAALIAIINAATAPAPWIPDDINEGRVDLYFLVLAAIMSATTLVYFLVVVPRTRRADAGFARAATTPRTPSDSLNPVLDAISDVPEDTDDKAPEA